MLSSGSESDRQNFSLAVGMRGWGCLIDAESIPQLPAGASAEISPYVVAGDNADSKLSPARALGIPGLPEDEFVVMIESL